MVSLLIVIFTALLTIVLTVGFMRVMVQGQQQTIASDLSRSAYDTAQAGVEDAKRALVRYQQVCRDANTPECTRQTAIIKKGDCMMLQQLGVGGAGSGESNIGQQPSDDQYQQAYTCVKLLVDSRDYIGTLDPDTTRLVPLRGIAKFDRVVVQWFSASDIKEDPQQKVAMVDLATTSQLEKLADWPRNRPALLRTQFIQFGDSFQLSELDARTDDGHMNTGTLFLYPASVGRSDPIMLYQEDARRVQPNGVLQQVACQPDIATVMYACRAVIVLPQAIGQDDNNRKASYLRLDGVYNQSNNFRIQLMNGNDIVNFSGVQAVVDSTGRASNQFRRVESRVELATSIFPSPRAAIDITGNLCKNFMVTDNVDDYTSGLLACDPSVYAPVE